MAGTADRGPRSPRVLTTLAAVLSLVFAVFLALGTWQIERRSWKLALIDRVERRIHAPAVTAPAPSCWPSVTADADEYRRVRASGDWLGESQTLVQAVTELGAGFWVMTPLRAGDGSVVLVNRGFVAGRVRPAVAAGSRTTSTVTGLLRLTEPGGGFLRRNDPAADHWYSRDVAAIARARSLGRVAPYFIDADAADAPGAAAADQPVGGLTIVAFHNNHLVYAVTWYALAGLVAFAGWRLALEERRLRRRSSATAVAG